MTLEDQLEQLADRTPPGNPAEVLAAARARAESRSDASNAIFRAAVAVVAAVVAVLALVAGVFALASGDDRDSVTVAGPDRNFESELRPEADTAADVSVAVDDLESVVASVSPLTASEQGWLDHTVTFENTGKAAVHLQDFRSGTMLGDREVAVATEGCGYGSSGDQPVEMGCRLNYRPVTIEPGGTHTITVTLWRNLAGMNPVGDGPYEWRLNIDIRDTPFDHPDQTGTTGTVTLTYENLTAPEHAVDDRNEQEDERGHVDDPLGPEQLSDEDAERLVSNFLLLADDPSPDAVERLPFAEEVRLGLGSDLHEVRSRSQLADPAAWVIAQELFRAYSGPFSALDAASGAQNTIVSVGEHPHCASPPIAPPEDVADLARVSVQPGIPQVDSCLQWWTVDLFVSDAGQIEAVTLDLWEP